jgi:predicted transcriptional regulator
MQTTSLQRELQRLSQDIEVPNHEHRDNHRFPEQLTIVNPDFDEFDALVQELWEAEIKEIHEGAKAVVSTKIAD